MTVHDFSRSRGTPLLRAYTLALLATTALGLACPCPAGAGAASATPDFSGVYTCTGQDAHEGPYEAQAELRRVPEHSVGRDVAYRFELKVPGFGTYPGHAVARGLTAAIYFALTDPTPRDFGTGLARFSRDAKGHWQFDKFYYEPEFKGGNHGNEHCVQQ